MGILIVIIGVIFFLVILEEQREKRTSANDKGSYIKKAIGIFFLVVGILLLFLGGTFGYLILAGILCIAGIIFLFIGQRRTALPPVNNPNTYIKKPVNTNVAD